jgi:hypothetical protein
MSSFRASPWVTYEPTNPSHRNRAPAPSESEMDEDVDMDAPQISTLREEMTPPPQPQRRVASVKKRPVAPPPPPPVHSDKEQEVEEEEDQLVDELIDDEDNGSLAKPSPSRIAESGQKRKVSSTKRKPRKSDKKLGEGEKEKKVKEKLSQPTGATMSWFKATPQSHVDGDMITSSPLHQPVESSASKGKKKVSPRKPPTIPRAKLKLAK